MTSGEVVVKLFSSADERTLFAEQLSPKKDLSYPLRDVAAIHAVVGVTFG
jgi:hypothetical protein